MITAYSTNAGEWCLPCLKNHDIDVEQTKKFGLSYTYYCQSCRRDASFPLERADYKLYQLDSANRRLITGLDTDKYYEWAYSMGGEVYQKLVELEARLVWESRLISARYQLQHYDNHKDWNQITADWERWKKNQ